MKSITLTFYFILAISLLFLQVGCKSYAKVTCATELQNFQSKSGTININQFSLGDVIIMDTVQHNASYVLHFVPGNTSTSSTFDSSVAMASSNFSVSLSGKIQENGSDAIKAEVQSKIVNNTDIILTKSYRQNIDNASPSLNQNPNLKTLIPICGKNKNIIVMVIAGLIFGDNFQLAVNKSVGLNANANIIKVGDFKIDVSYDCTNLGRVIAKKGAIFYKAQFYTYDKQTDTFIQTIVGVDLLKYNFVISAFQDR